jgi:uncharacterized protein
MERADNYAANMMADVLKHSVQLGSPDGGVPLRTVLIKPAGDACNLACKYCYETDRRNKTGKKLMTIELLDRILDNLLPFVTPPFSVGVHGGEPLLASRSLLQHLVDRFRREENLNATLSIQTNAVLIDEGWAQFFRNNRIGVGISLDGPDAKDNLLRIDPGGRESYSKVLRGVECLQKHEITFGVITVITPLRIKESDAAARLYHGFRDHGVGHYDIHPAYSPTPKARESNVTPEDYASFSIELFESWADRGDDQTEIGFIEHFFQGMTGLPGHACYRAGACSSILGIDADGSTSPCTRPFGDEYQFGNLAEETIVDILKSSAFHAFRNKELEGQRRTLSCEWSHLCGRGGCPHERLDHGEQAIDGHHVYCTCNNGSNGGYPAIFSHIKNSVERLLHS